MIRSLGIDVDGTMTDGGVYITSHGHGTESLKFNRRDGHGISLLKATGVNVFAITNKASLSVEFRCEQLEIAYYESSNKKSLALDILAGADIEPEEFAYIGDDLFDIELLQMAGFSACPGDAELEVKKVVNLICTRAGGNGAVREFINAILLLNAEKVNA